MNRSDDDLMLLTGILVGKLLGSGITAYVQVDEDDSYTNEVMIVLHDQIYEPVQVLVKVLSAT